MACSTVVGGTEAVQQLGTAQDSDIFIQTEVVTGLDTLHGGAFAVPHLLGQDQPGSAARLRLCL
jgi:hypothetical protein